MRYRRGIGCTLCFVFVAITVLSSTSRLSAQTTPSEAPGTAQRRAAQLRRGINASHWFAQLGSPGAYTKEHLQTAMTAEDIALIKSMGFDNVRLSVNPQPMFPMNRPNELRPEYLGYLDDAVKMILDHGLAVVIDLHPESDFKAKLAGDDDFVQQFADFWRALAQHCSSWDPDRVFFEILNEPEMSDRYRWYGVQAKLIAAIREGAPNHTIIAAGARWSDDDDLVFLSDSLRDTNIIYNFHFYEPHIFTHQGATWGSYYWHWVKGLRYPSTPESAAQTAASVPDAVDRLYVIRYGYDHWDAARVDAEISQAAEWARQHNVPLVCNEFGVYQAFSNPLDRAAWLTDVRTALEKNGIGWAMWDYSGGFGVVNRVNGHPVPDDLTVRALGLKGAR
jgi:aryl-phospho-beta-D-glucosidase BglC (GH1 family)